MTDQEIIKKFLDNVKAEIAVRLPKVTGKTARSLKVRTNKKGGLLEADAHIFALEDGRRPTGSGGGSRGTESLQKRILKWVKLKGIATEGNEVSLSWAISKSIHAKGTKLYQQGGGSGVLSSVISEQRVESLVASLANVYQISTLNSLAKDYEQKIQKRNA